jgi:predicted nucleotidyltransferase
MPSWSVIMDTLHLPAREALAQLCRRWRVTELALFGSAARGDARSDSDVDLMVTFQPDAPWSSLDLVDMRDELARLFGRRVDLVEEKAVRNPYRRASMLRDKSVLYAA